MNIVALVIYLRFTHAISYRRLTQLLLLGQDSQAALAMAYRLNAPRLHRLAGDTKLRNVHVRFEHRTMRYPNAADYVAGFMGATPVTAQFRTGNAPSSHGRPSSFRLMRTCRIGYSLGKPFPRECRVLGYFLTARDVRS